MRKYPWNILTLLLIPALMVSQQLTPTVVSTSGGFYTNSSGMLSSTIGEMSAIETYVSPFNILTQGFQQPVDFSTSVVENPKVDFSFDFYPNPSDGKLHLLTLSENSYQVNIDIVDVLGRKFERVEFLHQDRKQINIVDLSHEAQGIYFFSVMIKEIGSDEKKHFIRKIQIVK